MKTKMLLNWKHKINEIEHGYRVEMLALEDTPAYVGGLIGGRIRWFEKSAIESYEIDDVGRAVVFVSRTYAHRKGLLNAPLHP